MPSKVLQYDVSIVETSFLEEEGEAEEEYEKAEKNCGSYYWSSHVARM